MVNCYCTFAHLCGTYLMKEIASVRRSELALLKFPTTPHLLSYQPGKVGHKIDSCTSPSCTVHDAFQPTTSSCCHFACSIGQRIRACSLRVQA